MGLSTDKRCLVLNKKWCPTGINRVWKILSRTITGRFKILHPETFETYDFDGWVAKGVETDNVLRGGDLCFDVPEIVIATQYGGRHGYSIPWKPENVYRRDDYICQYCGLTSSEMNSEGRRITVDHIIPRCKGGENTFKNTTTSCSRCNNRKDNMDVAVFCEKNGYEVPKPLNPHQHPWAFRMGRSHPNSWNKFL